MVSLGCMSCGHVKPRVHKCKVCRTLEGQKGSIICYDCRKDWLFYWRTVIEVTDLKCSCGQKSTMSNKLEDNEGALQLLIETRNHASQLWTPG